MVRFVAGLNCVCYSALKSQWIRQGSQDVFSYSLSSTVAKSVQVPSNCVWLRWEMSRKRQAPGDSIGMSVWVMFGRFFPQVELCR